MACARSARAAGAEWLAVATAAEAAELRGGGLDGPLLIMGALTPDELDTALAADADVVVWREDAARAACDRGPERPFLHVKLDSGMGRLGTRDPAEASAAAELAGDRLAGLMTHFATADERGDDFFAQQLERFAAWAMPLKRERGELLVHAANSAATLRDPASHFDLVRCGVAIYGLDPFGRDPADHGLEPALELRSYVAEVKDCAPGESAGYGRRFVAQHSTRLATLPLGYGDGVRRGLTNNADVVIGGTRHPLVGTVSMDNITVDVGPDGAVRPGDEAVLIGAGVLAEELAERLGTINYEVTCGLSARVPRVHHRDGEPAR